MLAGVAALALAAGAYFASPPTVAAKGRLMATPVTAEGALSTGNPVALFSAHGRSYVSSTDFFTYDVSPGGKRFLVNRYQKPTQIPSLNIVLDATSDKSIGPHSRNCNRSYRHRRFLLLADRLTGPHFGNIFVCGGVYLSKPSERMLRRGHRIRR